MISRNKQPTKNI